MAFWRRMLTSGTNSCTYATYFLNTRFKEAPSPINSFAEFRPILIASFRRSSFPSTYLASIVGSQRGSLITKIEKHRNTIQPLISASTVLRISCMLCHATSAKLHVVHAAQGWDRWPAYPLSIVFLAPWFLSFSGLC